MSLADNTRGQTLYDFVIGVTVFLLVIGYVFAFIPGLFEPFAPDRDNNPARADRTVDFLTEDLLVPADGEAGVLNRSCTEYFFDVNGTDSSECSQFNAGDPFKPQNLRDLVGLPAGTGINVTMTRDGSIGTVNGSDRLALGPDTASVSGRITKVSRVVSFDGRDYLFVVKIW